MPGREGAGSQCRACTDPWRGVGIRPTKRHGLLVILLLTSAVLPLAGPAAPAPSQIQSKEAEARSVLEQINQLDAELEPVIEAYNAAQVRLERIVEQQKVNERRLEIARGNLGDAETTLEKRLVELYVNGRPDMVEVLLGASNLDDILDGIETANRVSDQDARILQEVQRFKAEVKEREAQLAAARRRQEQIVAEREAKKREIESRLAERRSLLASIRNQIEELKAEEQARQRRLAAQARERLSSSPPATEPIGTAAPPPRYGGVVGIAMQYLGIPYQWGGASPSTGFDCSGFVLYVFAQVGVSLPHNAAMQYGYGSPVARDALQPGDLVFFAGLSHMGIYIGGNQFIHSPHTGDVVKISSITDWYASTYVGARRL
jgi:peptidoglycan DL-endopeptidase CwlO